MTGDCTWTGYYKEQPLSSNAWEWIVCILYIYKILNIRWFYFMKYELIMQVEHIRGYIFS